MSFLKLVLLIVVGIVLSPILIPCAIMGFVFLGILHIVLGPQISI